MAENKTNFVNFVNNNEFVSFPLSPNNNSHSMVRETNGMNGSESSNANEITCHTILENAINTVDNDTNNNQSQTASDCGKQFIQEMSTEL